MREMVITDKIIEREASLIAYGAGQVWEHLPDYAKERYIEAAIAFRNGVTPNDFALAVGVMEVR